MPLLKFSVTSKKITIFRFMYKVILNPSNFSALDILFLELSNFCPFGFLMMIIPSFLYSPISVFLIMFDSWERIRAPTSSHTLALSKLPMVTSNN